MNFMAQLVTKLLSPFTNTLNGAVVGPNTSLSPTPAPSILAPSSPKSESVAGTEMDATETVIETTSQMASPSPSSYQYDDDGDDGDPLEQLYFAPHSSYTLPETVEQRVDDEYTDYDEESFNEPIPIGDPLLVDGEGRKFYTSLTHRGFAVAVGSHVKIRLEDPDEDKELLAVAVVVALFRDASDDELMGEVKWFGKPKELRMPKARLKKLRWLQHEVVELETLNVVPVVSIESIVDMLPAEDSDVETAKSSSSSTGYFYSSCSFVCRYLYLEDSESLHCTNPRDCLSRGLAASEFGYVYSASQAAVADEDCSTAKDIYAAAIRTLDLSVLPRHFPCRDEERAMIEAFLKNGIARGGSLRPMYISGLPGTGKTASVYSCVESLRKQALPRRFEFVVINCLKLKTPNDAYSILWKAVSDVHQSPQAALKKLMAHFDSLRDSVQATSSSSTFVDARPVVVCLVDEMDYLLTHNQGVMYNMLDWPMVPHSRLVLLGLANTMDLPERLHARISSRMGSFQERMIFKPYSIEQVDEILRARMAELNVFEPKSLQLLTRKAATIGGDLRAALKICQRSIEMHRDGLSPAALASSTVTPVPVQIVGKAAEEYRTTPLMKMTKSACTLYKVLFVSIITHNRAHGESRHISSDELYSRMLDAVSSLRAQTDFAMSIPPYSIFLDCIDRMVAEGFLVQETKREGRGVGAKAKRQPFHAIRMVKLRLDVSDVTNALRGECFEKLL